MLTIEAASSCIFRGNPWFGVSIYLCSFKCTHTHKNPKGHFQIWFLHSLYRCSTERSVMLMFASKLKHVLYCVPITNNNSFIIVMLLKLSMLLYIQRAHFLQRLLQLTLCLMRNILSNQKKNEMKRPRLKWRWQGIISCEANNTWKKGRCQKFVNFSVRKPF